MLPGLYDALPHSWLSASLIELPADIAAVDTVFIAGDQIGLWFYPASSPRVVAPYLDTFGSGAI